MLRIYKGNKAFIAAQRRDKLRCVIVEVVIMVTLVVAVATLVMAIQWGMVARWGA
tara:strand:- start:352 stop:516 length:165 start_codon:yes stop_codon:yes gene_type:complete